MVEFGAKLKRLRQERNLTQKQLGDLIGVGNSIIYFYEVGDRIPSPDVIIKLSRVFHVSSDYLLGIEKTESVDVTGLDEHDIGLIRELVISLHQKNS